MATPTYTLIDSVTLGSSASSVTFSSIPAGGDAVLVMEFKAGSSLVAPRVQINGDTGSNYSFVSMYGDGSSTYSGNNTLTDIRVGTATNTSAGFAKLEFADFSATDKNKSILGRHGNAGVSFGIYAQAYRWANNDAITSINISEPTDSFAAGSTFFLYNIAKAL